MPPQLREIGFHVQNHATQWHGFQHEIQFQEVGVAWIQLTLNSILLMSSPHAQPRKGDTNRTMWHPVINEKL